MRWDEPRVNAPVGDVVGLTCGLREQRQARSKLFVIFGAEGLDIVFKVEAEV